MLRSLIVVAASLALGSAQKILLSGPDTIASIDFDGNSFEVEGNLSRTHTLPSWILLKDDVLYAVDEFTDITNTITYDEDEDEFEVIQAAVGSSGVAHLELTQDGRYLIGSAYSEGSIDIWDTSNPGGELSLVKQISIDEPLGPNPDRQDGEHPHETNCEPTGQFCITNDLGTDLLYVLDVRDARFEIINKIQVSPPGAGPRHAVFYPAGVEQPTHYILLGELENIVIVYKLDYVGDNLELSPLQTISTFDSETDPASTAHAGEILLSSDSKHLYVTNRETGAPTDSIAHFTVSTIRGGAGNPALTLSELTSSGGYIPRMASLGPTVQDNSIMLVTNQQGENALLALERDPGSGKLGDEPLATLPNSLFHTPDGGAQFAKFVDVFPH